jgi:hypothetical protein
MNKPLQKNQFVILEHVTPNGTHWDLMLENEARLWTWRIDILAAGIPHSTSAERIVDHSLRFLVYEGPVQNGTASVKRLDGGSLLYDRITPETITGEMRGNRFNGRFVLHMENAPIWSFFLEQ